MEKEFYKKKMFFYTTVLLDLLLKSRENLSLIFSRF